jgi:RNA polymerase sigma factor (sigma-70 family)
VTPLLAQRLRTDRSFERLYRRHVSDVYHYALAVCRNPADAEDVTQTTFMNAFRAVQAGNEPRTPKNWLLAIAHNVMRQRFRASSRRPNEVELAHDVAAAVPDDDGYSAEDIRRALSELAFNQRSALVMRELEGRSYAEIAEILGLSVGAVETLIFRARRALREQLEESLTCHEAELAISRQLDGRLSRAEKGALRAHLRTCAECSSFARSQRAQRAALKGLAALPVPASLTSLFGGGAAVGTTVAAKAAAVTALGLLVAGGSVETVRHVRHVGHHAPHATVVKPAPASKATRPAAAVASHVAEAPGVRVRASVAEQRTSSHAPIRSAHRRAHHHAVAAPRARVSPSTAPPGVAPHALPPTSNGAHGRRAHGAPAVHPAVPKAVRQAHGRAARAQARANVHSSARATSPAPGSGSANGNGLGRGNGKTPAPRGAPESGATDVPMTEP